jgi:hypothetical protein
MGELATSGSQRHRHLRCDSPDLARVQLVGGLVSEHGFIVDQPESAQGHHQRHSGAGSVSPQRESALMRLSRLRAGTS